MVIFLLSALRARKSDNYCYCNSCESYNFKESKQEKKQRTDTIYDAKNIKRDNFIRSNREKSNFAIAILQK